VHRLERVLRSVDLQPTPGIRARRIALEQIAARAVETPRTAARDQTSPALQPI